MTDSATKSLDNIISQTNGFQALIDEEDWDELEALLASRQNQLEAIFASPIDESERLTVMQSIKTIIETDRNLSEQVQQAKNQSTREVIDLKKRTHAIKAYSQIHDDEQS
ncbi:flagellar protein FliT [Aliikangiella marina]|uniref:Flagellar protein FliT n=1 Tax=Aliikangiella marina TaxID=1712262 RepID=A0A545TDL3_9GAMM|nr:flagellar protein FliT [Aliikangiella marina]TQV75314.1 flagellar protein FliT [Aliikangiella marina]